MIQPTVRAEEEPLPDPGVVSNSMVLMTAD